MGTRQQVPPMLPAILVAVLALSAGSSARPVATAAAPHDVIPACYDRQAGHVRNYHPASGIPKACGKNETPMSSNQTQAATVTESNEPRSPTLATLSLELKKGNTAAIQVFWEKMKADGAPLVEPIEGDPDHSLVTFVWRGGEDVSSVALVLPSPLPNELHRLEKTDLFYRTYRQRNDWRTVYQFAVNTPPFGGVTDSAAAFFAARRVAQADPLNRRRFVRSRPAGGETTESLFDLPAAPPLRWIEERQGVAKGRLHDHTFQSVILGNERRVQVYTPPGYGEFERPCALLLVFDGPWHLPWMPTTLDNLLAEGRIPPLVAVFVDTAGPNRNRELGLSDQFTNVLARELVPWIRQHYRVTTDSSQAVVAGVSAGGLAAGFVALRHPELFGNVLSQSGTYWWWQGYQLGDDFSNVPTADQGWLITQYSTAPRLSLKFYLDVGLEEADPRNESFWFSNLAANRRLRDVLRAKGYAVHYVEFNGGHDYYAWRGTFPHGLIALLGK